MSVYEELALTPVINASATLTRLGGSGSRMPPAVIEAMSAAAGSFTDLDEMQQGWRAYRHDDSQRGGLRLLTRDEIVSALWEGSPRIAVGILKDEENAIALNPQTLEPGELEIVLATLRKVLHG